MTDLQRMSWDQASILRLATCNGFKALDIKPATVRKWASRGDITARGKAPGGAHLYAIDEVSKRARDAAD